MKHDLINTGDADVFPALLDRNGEVVLSYCRRCGLAEVELDRHPVCPGSKDAAQILTKGDK
jgi:hypothetical protein